ncbi:MAG: type I-B CRISPR-associated protein Cas5b [Candidatus Atabeyarchaeum deiterrae]
MRVLVFDVWGDYAHFKKRYTTTSPLTHSIPPRTTIVGLISAIAGLGRNEYQERFKDKSKIALRLLNPVKKSRISISLISTKNEHLAAPPLVNYFKQHTLINFEFLKDPKYRLYLFHSDKQFYERLRELLGEHKSVYTPALGLSGLIGNFRYIDEYDAEPRVPGSHGEYLEMNSVVPIRNSGTDKPLAKVQPEPDQKYSLETVPSLMKADREVEEYLEILVEEEGHPIKAQPSMYWEVGDGTRVVPF